MGTSEERTTWLGGKYTVHLDDDGNEIGRSEEKESLLGGRYTQHYDADGNKAGQSEQKESLLGGRYTQHYDADGDKAGQSEQKESFLGGRYTQHYDSDGDKVGTSERRESILGGQYTKHEGTFGGFPIASQDVSDTTGDYGGQVATESSSSDHAAGASGGGFGILVLLVVLGGGIASLNFLTSAGGTPQPAPNKALFLPGATEAQRTARPQSSGQPRMSPAAPATLLKTPDELFQMAEGIRRSRSDRQGREAAANHYRQAAEAGHPAAAGRLGGLYLTGEGVPRSDSAIVMPWSVSITGPSGVAEGYSGATYITLGAGRDYTQALALNRQGADGGDVRAMLNLARMYKEGLGTRKDPAQAAHWNQRAFASCSENAKGGDAESQCLLGDMFAQSLGTPRDFIAAEKWYHESAKQGCLAGKAGLGTLLYAGNGEGGRARRKEGLKWLREAAEQGYEPSKQFLRRLGEHWEAIPR
jgi:TPR repeat protein